MPTRCSTRRCFVTPCRVRSKPSASCAIERGRPSTRRPTSFNRVASPRAAKTGAAFLGARAALGLDILGDAPGLDVPSFRVGTQRVNAALVVGYRVEPRLRDHELRSLLRRLEPELDARLRRAREVAIVVVL